jgi:hypothetical protein
MGALDLKHREAIGCGEKRKIAELRECEIADQITQSRNSQIIPERSRSARLRRDEI